MTPTRHAIRRIHITGATGAGTTTLGQALAEKLSRPHLDTDSFYWVPTSPPFQQRTEVDERLANMQRVLGQQETWILSGSLDGWGDPLIPLFDAVIFVTLQNTIRMARLRAREATNHGDAILPGGAMHDHAEAFIQWAAAYDAGDRPGRSRKRHEAWLANLPCPVIRLENDRAPDSVADKALALIAELETKRQSA